MKRKFDFDDIESVKEIKKPRAEVSKDEVFMNINKKMIIFDTETTDTSPGNICQLAYLIVDDKGITPKNHFFKVKKVEPGAENVHGMSVEMLKKLSRGKDFSEQINSIYKDFTSADLLVAHNSGFDMKFLVKEFRRCGKDFDPDNIFCTMKHFTNICKIPKKWGKGNKWPSLQELSEFLSVNPEETKSLVKDLYASDVSAHDARFDIVNTYLCIREGLKKGYIFKNELDIEKPEFKKPEFKKPEFKKTEFAKGI
jgi:DNA polymerase-3 subunit epsilon